jgi:hypothetical protein
MIRVDSYELVLVALSDPTAADVRIQRVLKSLLRTYRFRCKSIKRVKAETKKKRVKKTKART